MTKVSAVIAGLRISVVPFVLILMVAMCGCAQRQMIIASTATNIGVEISENPAKASPQAKLGYQRAELALVPTNRSGESDTSGGADQCANVLMELKYSGIFSFGADSCLYQRLAVGKDAVTQRGAAFMFARDASGNLSDKAASAIEKSFASIKKVPPVIDALLTELALRFTYASKERKQMVRNTIKNDPMFKSFSSYDDLMDKEPDVPTEEQIRVLLTMLEEGP